MPRRSANSGPPTHSSSAWTGRTCRQAPWSPRGPSCPLARPHSGHSRKILRRACQVALDIDPQELVMGLQARVVDGNPSARVFLADALDNGAGYAVELGKPEVFARILDQRAAGTHRRLGGPRPRALLHGLLPRLPAVLRQQAAPRGAGLAARPRHDRPRGGRVPEDRPLARARCLRRPCVRAEHRRLADRRTRRRPAGACSTRTTARRSSSAIPCGGAMKSTSPAGSASVRDCRHGQPRACMPWNVLRPI